MRTGAWRLLIDPPGDAAYNMAVDDLLLEAQSSSSPTPTLRLYSWNPPALSLGRGQSAEEACDGEFLRSAGIDLIRRPTGGAAVLHGDERTYAVAGALDGPFAGGVLETYRTVATVLLRALRRLGVEVGFLAPAIRGRRREPSCFEQIAPHELGVDGKKLVGSAQYRRRRTFLQHGSIPFRIDPVRLAGVLRRPPRTERFTDLESALGRRPSIRELDAQLIRAFEEAFSVSLEPGRLTVEERLRVEQLRCWKYESTAWTLDGKVGVRERRWGPRLI